MSSNMSRATSPSSDRSSTSSSSDSGVYVPVHKRSGSDTSGSRSSSLTRDHMSPRVSSFEIEHVQDGKPCHHLPMYNHRLINAPPALPPRLPIYTPSELLLLAQSPLSDTLPPQILDPLLKEFPEVVMTRRDRRARSYKDPSWNVVPRGLKSSATDTTAPRRRPVGRVPERSRNHAKRVVDEANWRRTGRPIARTAGEVVLLG